MSNEPASESTTFDRARRRSAYRRLARVVGGRDGADLLPLDEATERLRPFHRRYVGLRVIPLEQIAGPTAAAASSTASSFLAGPSSAGAGAGSSGRFPTATSHRSSSTSSATPTS